MNHMNRRNLETLAAYLEALPADYKSFSMGHYWSGNERPFNVLGTQPTECGSVACAVGHGPSAGLGPLPHEDWNMYAFRVFFNVEGYYTFDQPLDEPNVEALWSWCFAASWVKVDNTPQGAARRIRHMLASEANAKSIGDMCPVHDWPDMIALYKELQ